MNLIKAVQLLDLAQAGEEGDVLTRIGPKTVGFAAPAQASRGMDGGTAMIDQGSGEMQYIPWTFNGVRGYIPFIPAP